MKPGAALGADRDRSCLGLATNAEGDRTRLPDPGAGEECLVSQPGFPPGAGSLVNVGTKETHRFLGLKEQPTEWENIFATNTSDEGLISQIYKEHIQVNTKKDKQSN